MMPPYDPASLVEPVPAFVPVPAAPLFDFSDWQSTHPTAPLPGTSIDAEFANGYDVTNNLIARLAMIQRDDGALMNEIVMLDSLNPEVMEALEALVQQADDSAANAAAAEAAAQAAQAAAVASATSANASEASAQAAATAGAADAAAAAASATAADASADAAAADLATMAAIMPPMPTVPGNAIQVDATGNAYEFTRFLGVGTADWDAEGRVVKNAGASVLPNDLATRADVESMVSGAGSVPAPIDGTDDNKQLTATGGGFFGWRAFLAEWISDATAYMQGLLRDISDAADLRATADLAQGTTTAAAIAGKQAVDPMLTALSNLVTAANDLAYFTGPDAVALTQLSAFMRTVLDDVDAAAARATLGAPGLTVANTFTGQPQTVDAAGAVSPNPYIALGTEASGAAGPFFATKRLRAVAAAGGGGGWKGYTKDAANAEVVTAAIFDSVTSVVAGAVTAAIDFWTIQAGAFARRFKMGLGFYADGLADQGAGTVNATALYDDGVQLVSVLGRQSKYISAAEWVPGSGAGPSRSITATAVNGLMDDCLVFDGATNESATFDWTPPKQWDKGNVTFLFYWKAAAGTVAQTCIMQLGGVAVGNNESPDAAPAGTQSATDGLDALNVQLTSPESAAIAFGGTPATAERIRLKLTRNAASDTLTGDIFFYGVTLFYTINAGNDA